MGYCDERAGLQCNPYLIVDGEEAVLIDSGGRSEFSSVMLKVMRTGTDPGRIRRLIYQHYDPDLCGNIPHVEAIIQNDDLEIISHRENNIFIRYYGAKSPLRCVEKMRFQFAFSSGRRLEFAMTPYAHAPGSFMTYDTRTKILFSSDIFGSYDHNWDLFADIPDACGGCPPQEICPRTGERCYLCGVMNFHQRVMPSKRALRHALRQVEKFDISMIAPQHGSILANRHAQEVVIRNLKALEGIGIEGIAEEEN